MAPDPEPGDRPKRRRGRRRPGCSGRFCQLLTVLTGALLAALWVAQRGHVDRSPWVYLATYGPQIAFAAVPAAVALLCAMLRQRRAALANVLLLLVAMHAFVRPTWPHRPVRHDPARTIRVVTWNVHNEHQHMDRFRQTMDRLQPDIVCLQETWRGSFADGWRASTRTHEVTTMTSGCILRSRGVRLGESPNFRWALETEIELPQGRVTVLNVHYMAVQIPVSIGPRLGDPQLFYRTQVARTQEQRVVMEWLRTTVGPVILAGDFNTPPNAPEYRELETLATNSFEAGSGLGFTFHRRQPMLRIDHIWCRGGTRPVTSRAQYGGLSDHFLVVADVEMPSGSADDSE